MEIKISNSIFNIEEIKSNYLESETLYNMLESYGINSYNIESCTIISYTRIYESQQELIMKSNSNNSENSNINKNSVKDSHINLSNNEDNNTYSNLTVLSKHNSKTDKKINLEIDSSFTILQFINKIKELNLFSLEWSIYIKLIKKTRKEVEDELDNSLFEMETHYNNVKHTLDHLNFNHNDSINHISHIEMKDDLKDFLNITTYPKNIDVVESNYCSNTCNQKNKNDLEETLGLLYKYSEDIKDFLITENFYNKEIFQSYFLTKYFNKEMKLYNSNNNNIGSTSNNNNTNNINNFNNYDTYSMNSEISNNVINYNQNNHNNYNNQIKSNNNIHNYANFSNYLKSQTQSYPTFNNNNFNSNIIDNKNTIQSLFIDNCSTKYILMKIHELIDSIQEKISEKYNYFTNKFDSFKMSLYKDLGHIIRKSEYLEKVNSMNITNIKELNKKLVLSNEINKLNYYKLLSLFDQYQNTYSILNNFLLKISNKNLTKNCVIVDEKDLMFFSSKLNMVKDCNDKLIKSNFKSINFTNNNNKDKNYTCDNDNDSIDNLITIVNNAYDSKVSFSYCDASLLEKNLDLIFTNIVRFVNNSKKMCFSCKRINVDSLSNKSFTCHHYFCSKCDDLFNNNEYKTAFCKKEADSKSNEVCQSSTFKSDYIVDKFLNEKKFLFESYCFLCVKDLVMDNKGKNISSSVINNVNDDYLKANNNKFKDNTEDCEDNDEDECLYMI